jgi:hypothetical protein
MKILDYITLVSTTGKTPSEDLLKFAADSNAEVFTIEHEGVVVICEADEAKVKIKSGMKYDMYAIGKMSKGHIAGSDKKENLIKCYSQLLAEEYVDLSRMNLSLAEDLKEIVDAKLSKLDTTSSI